MAVAAGTTGRTIQQAKAVEESGSVVLREAVKAGEISVKKAAKVAKLPKAKQAKAMKEPAPKKEKPKDDDGEMVKELEAADSQIRSLQELVESLKKSDLAKEVVKWREKFAQLEGRLRQCMTTKGEAEKQAKYSTSLLAQIRKALKVQKNSEILPALKK